MVQPALHIIADANIWGATHAFSHLKGYKVLLEVLEHKDITSVSVKNADILLVRSLTRVNKTLLEGSRVRFVGTATIGDDHIDKAYLDQQQIMFSSAAGSSTESVVEYMLAALFRLQQLQHIDLQQATMGIIGVGRIGSLLDKACRKSDIRTLRNDPPRAVNEGETGFHSLDTLLEQADILTLHTPLTDKGAHQTRHLIGQAQLEQFQGKGIINAGRGPCLDNAALLHWLDQDKEHFAVLDCWEHEPTISLGLAQHPQVMIASPHIAGHSLDGKAANTKFVYDDLCEFLDIEPSWDIEAELPAIDASRIPPGLDKQTLSQLLYPIAEDSRQMKEAAVDNQQLAGWFSTYRRNYPVRRSWKKSLAAQEHYPERLFF